MRDPRYTLQSDKGYLRKCCKFGSQNRLGNVHLVVNQFGSLKSINRNFPLISWESI